MWQTSNTFIRIYHSDAQKKNSSYLSLSSYDASFFQTIICRNFTNDEVHLRMSKQSQL